MAGYLLTAILAAVAGLVIGYIVLNQLQRRRKQDAGSEADRIINEAKQQAKNTVKESELQAKDTIFQAKQEIEKEIKEKRRELGSFEKRLLHKEENLDKKVDLLDHKEMEVNKRDKNLASREKTIEENEKHVRNVIEEVQDRLEKVAGMTAADAKKELMENMITEARHDAAKKIKLIEEETREECEKIAKKIIVLAIQRYAGDYVAERTVSVIPLPNDEMKGRIIGREGRNIRTIEALTGIDLIVDDTPEAVVISAFNPIRREVARLTLEKLISDGRIHPARIEEIVKKAEKEIDDAVKNFGQQAIFDMGLHGMHPELIKLLGRLKYRTSYGQNQYQHSLEVGFLCGIMASELKLNVKEAKRSGLLHDIGKAIDHEVEGSHAQIGADLCRKYGEKASIVTAIGGHHDDEPPSIYAVLVQAADALSGARPGARREMLETYVKRLEELEQIANSFQGIGKSYAIQAGREIRIVVESGEVTDAETTVLSKDIARKIENELTYPGQIKVTVIRETRSIEYAK